ncbi:reverse transcriptase-like protein [Sphingomonas sp. Ant20]|uniref:reverse transcriptase-like protein n=1 Tax=Sphingomonas sp. Ant20 TaxID=104605 RepID=UPI000FE14588|nr:reverse transcriptase-like protein [Sphingomonas sp. Ant20]
MAHAIRSRAVKKVLGLQFADRRARIVSDTGNSSEAAWLAYFYLAFLARSMGLKAVTLKTNNRHVVNQLTGRWKARSPMMRRYRDAFLATFADMRIEHTY